MPEWKKEGTQSVIISAPRHLSSKQVAYIRDALFYQIYRQTLFVLATEIPN
jgi:hypothetical protein